jgi:hypothetical protein
MPHNLHELLFFQGIELGNMILVAYEYNNLFTQFHPNQIFNILSSGFRLSCRKNSIRVSRWLFIKMTELSKELNYQLNIHETDNTNIDAFEMCCMCGNIEIAKFILEMVSEHNLDFDIHIKEESYFATCCYNNRLEMGKWLFEKSNEVKSPINIRINKDRIFRTCCIFNFVEAAKMLCDMCSNYKIENIGNNKLDYTIIPDIFNMINTDDIINI